MLYKFTPTNIWAIAIVIPWMIAILLYWSLGIGCLPVFAIAIPINLIITSNYRISIRERT